MTDDSFVRAILDKPTDAALRLVYADWLDERGDGRGEYLRLATQCQMQPLSTELRGRLEQLGPTVDPRWLSLLKTIDRLAEIQLHYRFALPDGYKLWASKGYFTHPSSEYLWVHEREWIPLAELPGYKLTSFPHISGLVPFAFTGGGDHWCWQTDQVSGANEYRILRCAHDSNMATVDSPTFAGWFYRACLDCAGYVENKEQEIATVKQMLNSWSDRLDELGREDWAADVRELAKRVPFSYRWGPRNIDMFGFLTIEEANDRVRRELGQDYVDREIEWQS